MANKGNVHTTTVHTAYPYRKYVIWFILLLTALFFIQWYSSKWNFNSNWNDLLQ